jgi:micrococcal nuclease
MKLKYTTLILALLFLIFAISCPPRTPIVTRVIDGDTIEVSMGGTLYRVRYIGIDTPELDDERPRFRALAQEAAELNRQLVEEEKVRLEKDISDTDRYGRLLRYVYVDGIFVNIELVRQGLAWAKAYPPDVKYQDVLEEAEAEARQEEIGVWQETQ